MANMIKVFVYGTLKQGYGNHRVMERAQGRFLGCDKIRDFACINAMSFPYAIKQDGATIIGEVYELDEGGLYHLDMLEGYPHHYQREMITTKYGEAWIYFSHKDLQDLVNRYGLVEEWI